MKLLSASLLLLTIIGAANAQCGNNALLTADMIARFGGSANILSTPVTLNVSTATCGFLANQSVCVSDAGFTYFKTYIATYKANFTSQSQQRDQKRYANVGASLSQQNQTDPRTQNIIQVGIFFNQTIINFNTSGVQAPYDFGAFLGKIQSYNSYIAPTPQQITQQNQLIVNNNTQNGQPACQGVNNSTSTTVSANGTNCGGQAQQTQQTQQTSQNNTQNNTQQTQVQNGTTNKTRRFRNMQQTSQNVGQLPSSAVVGTSGSPTQQGVATNTTGWNSLQQNLGQAKAKCGVAVMKQYYYTTCLAALVGNATNGTVQGDTTSSKVTMSSDACTGYKSKCLDYFTYASQAENVKANVDNANSLFAIQVYAIVSNSSLSKDQMNAQLNVYGAQVLAALNSAAQSQVTKPWNQISCNSTNTAGSDCNYVCTNMITGNGVNTDSFNLVSTNTATGTSPSRVLATSTVVLSSTSSGINPDSAITDTDSNVVVSVQSNPDTSSARALVTSLVVIALSFLAVC